MAYLGFPFVSPSVKLLKSYPPFQVVYQLSAETGHLGRWPRLSSRLKMADGHTLCFEKRLRHKNGPHLVDKRRHKPNKRSQTRTSMHLGKLTSAASSASAAAQTCGTTITWPVKTSGLVLTKWQSVLVTSSGQIENFHLTAYIFLNVILLIYFLRPLLNCAELGVKQMFLQSTD